MPAPAATPAPHVEPAANAPTNRVDIPAPVRTNLGITFATVERRAVAKTLRVPGRFELLPTARRELRAPLGGRIELLVEQHQRVEIGTPLYRLESAAWRDIEEQAVRAGARLSSMGTLRKAHKVHEEALDARVKLWQKRVEQLEAIREAGGGSGDRFTEAHATLASTQAELADVMEKDAELEAQQQSLESEMRWLASRREQLMRAAGSTDTPGPGVIEVRATHAGVVDAIGAASGGLVDEAGLVLSVVQPERVRFVARAPQSDLSRLSDGLNARVVPPMGDASSVQTSIRGELALGVVADAESRTVELFVTPTGDRPSWVRAGVAAQLEVTLAGASEELAVPSSCVFTDGAQPVIFRRDPSNPDKAIRIVADVGVSDGRWTAIGSGVREGDQVVLGGGHQLVIATSGSAPKGGHFHSDGTWHEGSH